MGGFTNAVVGGASTLIRAAIKSQNYVAGVAGWIIQKNGAAEFNNIVVRGSFFAGSPTGPNGAVTIQAFPGFGGDINLWPIPSNVAGSSWQPAIIYAGRDEAGGSPTTTTPTLHIESPAIATPSTLHASNLVLKGQTTLAANDDSTIFIQAQSITGQTTSGANAGDMGYGFVAEGSLWTNGGGVVGGAQVAQINVAAPGNFIPTFAAGRCYRVQLTINVQTTAVAAAPVVEIRKGTATGQRFGSWRIGPTVAGFPYGFSATCYFVVGPNANVSATLLLSLGGAAGQTVNLTATADNGCIVTIYDDGLASNRPNTYPVIT